MKSMPKQMEVLRKPDTCKRGMENRGSPQNQKDKNWAQMSKLLEMLEADETAELKSLLLDVLDADRGEELKHRLARDATKIENDEAKTDREENTVTVSTNQNINSDQEVIAATSDSETSTASKEPQSALSEESCSEASARTTRRAGRSRSIESLKKRAAELSESLAHRGTTDGSKSRRERRPRSTDALRGSNVGTSKESKNVGDREGDREGRRTRRTRSTDAARGLTTRMEANTEKPRHQTSAPGDLHRTRQKPARSNPASKTEHRPKSPPRRQLSSDDLLRRTRHGRVSPLKSQRSFRINRRSADKLSSLGASSFHGGRPRSGDILNSMASTLEASTHTRPRPRRLHSSSEHDPKNVALSTSDQASSRGPTTKHSPPHRSISMQENTTNQRPQRRGSLGSSSMSSSNGRNTNMLPSSLHVRSTPSNNKDECVQPLFLQFNPADKESNQVTTSRDATEGLDVLIGQLRASTHGPPAGTVPSETKPEEPQKSKGICFAKFLHFKKNKKDQPIVEEDDSSSGEESFCCE